MRCNEKFELFWKDVQNKAANLHTNPPKLSRKRRAPPRIAEYLGVKAAPELDDHIISDYRKFTMKLWIV